MAPWKSSSSCMKPAVAVLIAVVAVLFLKGSLWTHTGDVSGLRLAIAERLALIPDVARHKWNTGVAIADPVREQRLIEASLVNGRQAGVPDRITRGAIEAQITASKQMQEELIQSWRETGQGTFGAVPDFLKETRPRIETATDRIIQELGKSHGILNTCPAATALREPPAGQGISEAVWATAVEGLIQAAGGPVAVACQPR